MIEQIESMFELEPPRGGAFKVEEELNERPDEWPRVQGVVIELAIKRVAEHSACGN